MLYEVVFCSLNMNQKWIKTIDDAGDDQEGKTLLYTDYKNILLMERFYCSTFLLSHSSFIQHTRSNKHFFMLKCFLSNIDSLVLWWMHLGFVSCPSIFQTTNPPISWCLAPPPAAGFPGSSLFASQPLTVGTDVSCAEWASKWNEVSDMSVPSCLRSGDWSD